MSRKTEQSVFDRVANEFRDVHGSEADAEWASTAAMTMVWKDVREPYVEAVLGAASQNLQESSESAQATFGSPDAWAQEQISWLKSEGFDAIEPALGPVPLPVAVENCLWLATWFSVLFSLTQLLGLLPGREPWELSIVMALSPLLLAGCCSITYATYAWSRPRHRFATSVVMALPVVALCAGATAVLLLSMVDAGPRLAWPWTFALVGVYGLLAWGVSTLPSRSSRPEVDSEQPPTTTSLDAEVFSRRLAAALRSRDDVDDAAIESTVSEARSHLEESGHGATDEFGSPEGYANTVPADPSVRPRRKMLLYGALVGVWLVLLISEIVEHGLVMSWSLGSYAALVLLGVWFWSDAYRDWRRAVRGKASRGRPELTG
ncbi:MAG: hypothetical protein ACTIJJ_14740 [Galactobacter sp.]